MKNVEIIPAILPMTFGDLYDHLAKVASVAKTAQIDICDGKFVPTVTWPLRKEDFAFERIIKEDEGLPFWPTFTFEVHLMVEKPEDFIEDWMKAGVARIILHVESPGDFGKIVQMAGETVELALSVNMETPIEALDPFIPDIKAVQFMGIDKVGYQGQKFDEKVIEKIKMFRSKYPDMIISVDGGVNLENAGKLKEVGANRLVVGSYRLFEKA
jgi:ribulose-phosphate 3-epimerase